MKKNFDLEGFAEAIVAYEYETEKGSEGSPIAAMKEVKKYLNQLSKLELDDQIDYICKMKYTFPTHMIKAAKNVGVKETVINLMGISFEDRKAFSKERKAIKKEQKEKEQKEKEQNAADKAFGDFSRDNDPQGVLGLIEKCSDLSSLKKIRERYEWVLRAPLAHQKQNIKIVNKYNERLVCLKNEHVDDDGVKKSEFLTFDDQDKIIKIAKNYANKKLDDEKKKEAKETLNALKAEIVRGTAKIKSEAAEVLVSADPFAIEILDKKISKKRSIKKAARKALLAGIKRGDLKFDDFVDNDANSKKSLFDKKVVAALVKAGELTKESLVSFNKNKSAIDVARDEHNKKVGDGIKIDKDTTEDEAVTLVQCDVSLYRLLPDELKKNARVKKQAQDMAFAKIKKGEDLKILKCFNLEDELKDESFKAGVADAVREATKKEITELIISADKIEKSGDLTEESKKTLTEVAKFGQKTAEGTIKLTNISSEVVKGICKNAEAKLAEYGVIQERESRFEKVYADWVEQMKNPKPEQAQESPISEPEAKTKAKRTGKKTKEKKVKKTKEQKKNEKELDNINASLKALLAAVNVQDSSKKEDDGLSR